MRFIATYIILVSVLFFPPISQYTGEYRLDTFLLVPTALLLLLSKNYSAENLQSKYNLRILSPFLILATSVAISLLIQSFTYSPPFALLITNFFGYSRPLLVGYIVLNGVSSICHIRRVINLILYSVIFHGICSIIGIFSVPYFSELLSTVYRPVTLSDWGAQRAIGAFNTEHGLAYYGLLVNIFILFLIRLKNIHLVASSKLLPAAYLMSFVCMLLSMSKSTFAAFAISYTLLITMLFKPLHFHRFSFKLPSLFQFVLIIFFLLCFACLLLVLPDSTYDALGYQLNELAKLSSLILDSSDTQPTFISARLNWGWANALSAFLDDPLVGDITVSLRIFSGDGGYTESLGMHGLIGFGGLLAFLALIFFGKIIPRSTHSTLSDLSFFYRQLALTLSILLIGTGVFRPRIGELIPVLVILPLLIQENLSIISSSTRTRAISHVS